MAGQGMGRAAGNEVVPVGMLEKTWGQLSLEIKEKKGVICGRVRAGGTNGQCRKSLS